MIVTVTEGFKTEPSNNGSDKVRVRLFDDHALKRVVKEGYYRQKIGKTTYYKVAGHNFIIPKVGTFDVILEKAGTDYWITIKKEIGHEPPKDSNGNH